MATDVQPEGGSTWDLWLRWQPLAEGGDPLAVEMLRQLETVLLIECLPPTLASTYWTYWSWRRRAERGDPGAEDRLISAEKLLLIDLISGQGI